MLCCCCVLPILGDQTVCIERFLYFISVASYCSSCCIDSFTEEMPAPDAIITWFVSVLIFNINIQENSSSSRFLQSISVLFDTMIFPLPLDNSLAYARNSAKWLATDRVWKFRPGVSGILRIFPVPDRIRSSDDLYIHNNIHTHSLSCPGPCQQQLPDPYVGARWLSAQVTGNSQEAQLQARPSSSAGQQATMSSKDYVSFSGQI